MPRPTMRKKLTPWPKHVAHRKTGKAFVVTGFAPGGNEAHDYLRVRPVLATGKLGKPVVRWSENFCPVPGKSKRWEGPRGGEDREVLETLT